MERNEQAHLDILDGLRGIAILLVFWFHIWQLSWLEPAVRFGPLTLDLNPIVRTGFLGVDLFFFLSGFCLFHPYAREHFDRAPRPRLARFAYRRAVKILPSYALAVAGAFALGYAQRTFSGGAWEALRVHALFFLPSFPVKIASLSGVLWSLGVEAQFYLLFPAVAWCLRKQPILTMICALLIASGDRAYVIRLNTPDPYILLEQLPASIDLFVSGMFAAYVFRFLDTRCKARTDAPRTWTLLALCGVALYVTTAMFIYGTAFTAKNWPYPSYPVAFPLLDLSFTAVALGSLFGLTAWRRALANPALVFLAYISYNLYLWHQMIAFEMFQHAVPPHDAKPYEDPAWQRFFTLYASAAGIAIAAVITAGIERPLMRLRVKPRSE